MYTFTYSYKAIRLRYTKILDYGNRNNTDRRRPGGGMAQNVHKGRLHKDCRDVQHKTQLCNERSIIWQSRKESLQCHEKILSEAFRFNELSEEGDKKVERRIVLSPISKYVPIMQSRPKPLCLHCAKQFDKAEVKRLYGKESIVYLMTYCSSRCYTLAKMEKAAAKPQLIKA